MAKNNFPSAGVELQALNEEKVNNNAASVAASEQTNSEVKGLTHQLDEERINMVRKLLPLSMWQQKKFEVAKRKNENAAAEAATSDEHSVKESALGVTLSLAEKLRRKHPLLVCSPDVAGEAGIAMVDVATGEVVTEYSGDDVLIVPDATTYPIIYTGLDDVEMIDVTADIDDFSTWCKVVKDLMHGSLSTEQSFFLNACILDNEAMKAVLALKERTGCSLDAAKTILNYREGQVIRTKADGTVKTSSRGWAKTVPGDGVQILLPTIDEQIDPEGFAAFVNTKVDEKVTMRTLLRKKMIPELRKEYLKQLQGEQKGDQGRVAHDGVAEAS